MQSFDFVVVGGGIVGLTTALALRRRYPQASITVLEKEPALARHASGRNSGVLHSGIYCGPQTLKAQVCAAGARLMSEFAREHNICLETVGKVIVATDERELPVLDRLLANARANGVRAVRLDLRELREAEPFAAGLGGVHTPDTAVIDAAGVIHALSGLLTTQRVAVRTNAGVKAIDMQRRILSTGSERYGFGYMFNCAGAYADRIARLCGLSRDYALVPFKGIYYKLHPEKAYLVRSNIYPVPDLELPFLGVHFTRVIGGEVFVGPTAMPAFGRENYGALRGLRLGEATAIGWQLGRMYLANNHRFRQLVHREVRKYRKSKFVDAARRLVPCVADTDLLLTHKVGIRPQLVRLSDQRLEMDFVLESTATSMHVLNAISPAFTSSFAFSELIVSRAEQAAGVCEANIVNGQCKAGADR